VDSPCTRAARDGDLDGDGCSARAGDRQPAAVEIGHVSWFQEFWCLRQLPGAAPADFDPEGPRDALYDSSAVAHDTRWDLPLPDLKATRAYGDAVLEKVRERLAREPEARACAYFVRLATFHEDMHAEAFHYTRQTLGI
jgi:iron(II)-dependent oxidoreductase